MSRRPAATAWIGAAIRAAVFVLVVIGACSIAVAPAAAETTAPSEHAYDGTDLLAEGSVTASGTVTLTPNGTAREGDVIRIEIDDDHPAFEIQSATDATGEDVGIDLTVSARALEVEFTDLGGDGSLDGTQIPIEVDLSATDDAAGRSDEYDSAPIATVTRDDTDSGLVGSDAIAVTVDGTAEIGFDAESIDDTLRGENLRITERGSFAISFSNKSVWVDDGDMINVSIDPDVLNESDTDGLRIIGAVENTTQNENISNVDVSTSSNANVLDGYNDQISVKINTRDGKPRLISNEAISIEIELAVEKESMKYTADRYRNVDLFEVDVEGENNTELTDNADVTTESPVILDIYPGEASADGFELEGIESNDEFPVGEGRSLAIDGLEDEFGNEIPRAEFEFTVDGPVDRRVYDGVWTATDGTGELAIANGGEIDAPVGVFDLSAEVTDVPGPATQSENTGAAVTETADTLSAYPSNVTVTTTQYSDFDLDSSGGIEVAVDLGVADSAIGRVDLELERERGAGNVTIDADGGSPTATDLWTETGYAGDDHLGDENAWAIERNLTAADFDDGVRRYVLDADAADRYEIAVEVMPREASLVPDASEIETSLAGDPGGGNRDRVEIAATGPIAAVENVSVRTDHEFVGIDVDEGGPVEIELEGFEDENGNAITNTDETVPVRFGGTEVAVVGPTGGSGSVTVTADPTAIDPEAVETGAAADVVVAFNEGIQRNGTDLTMVHRVIERSGNAWRAGSIPQPASLYVDAEGRRDLVQWNSENDTYESIAANASGDTLETRRIEHEDLHRGFYAYAEGDGLRIGFEYATDVDESIGTGEVGLGEGWHLASSNYDVSAHPARNLEDDLTWEEYGFGDDEDGFAVWNRNHTERLHDATDGLDVDGSAESIGHDETYWVHVDDGSSPLVRVVNSPIFSESDGVRE